MQEVDWRTFISTVLYMRNPKMLEFYLYTQFIGIGATNKVINCILQRQIFTHMSIIHLLYEFDFLIVLSLLLRLFEVLFVIFTIRSNFKSKFVELKLRRDSDLIARPPPENWWIRHWRTKLFYLFIYSDNTIYCIKTFLL